MSRLLLSVLLLSTAFIFVPSTVQAQTSSGFEKCGEDIVLVFKNPDLRPREDGKIHASGWFFIQFQAIGDKAMEIQKFTFSFGKPIPKEMRKCDTPQWITGAYLQNYRVDNDPRDGFFVPINTSLVPDGEYGAAVHAYDASGKELVRYYISAMVDNGGRASTRDPIKKDFTAPWPMVLPGDGEQTHPVSGLTIEFAEPIQRIDAYLNGVKLPLTDWTPPARDDDAIPDNPANPSVVERVWGPGYKWEGSILSDDVVKVVAVDMWNNSVEKVLHIGDPFIGGRIGHGTAELDVQINATEQTADDRGQASYKFSVANTGNGAAHGNIIINPQDGIRAKFSKDHITIGPGKALDTYLNVTALVGAEPKLYTITGYISYQHGEVEEQKPFSVSFRLTKSPTDVPEEETLVGSRPAEQTDDGAGEPVATGTENADTPGPAAGLVALALVGAALVLRRRRA